MPLIDSIAIIFMLLGGINFGMHWYAWRRATIGHYQSDSELRSSYHCPDSFSDVGLRCFSAAGSRMCSMPFATTVFSKWFPNITTSGFTSDGFMTGSGLAPLLLIMVGFIGGCAGSTAGGIKVARVQMVVRQGLREIANWYIRKAAFVTLGGKRVSESVISVAGFCTLYICSYLVMTLILAANGVDIVTAFRRCRLHQQCRAGPRNGRIHQALDDLSIWVCSFAMILADWKFLSSWFC